MEHGVTEAADVQDVVSLRCLAGSVGLNVDANQLRVGDAVMPNMENYFLYHDYQYQLVSHILVLGFGAMVAGLVYFLLTAQSIMPKYRISSYIGCVVMVSAGLILFTQYQSWEQAFIYVNEDGVTGWLNKSSIQASAEDGVT